MRYSLRVFFAILTGVCLLTGWIGWKVRLAKVEMAAIREITEAGGIVYYDYAIEFQGDQLRAYEKPSRPIPWFDEMVGVHVISQVVAVDLKGSGVNDLRVLRGLRQIVWLDFSDTDCRSLSPLEHFGSLSYLSLNNTRIASLDGIEKCKHLKWLSLRDTDVVSVGPLRFCTELESLTLSDTMVRDLSPLDSCSNLKSLELDGVLASNIWCCARLSRLEMISMRRTDIDDFVPLRSMSSLNSISLRDARIKDVSQLCACVQISELDVTGSSLDLQDVRRLRSALAKLPRGFLRRKGKRVK